MKSIVALFLASIVLVSAQTYSADEPPGTVCNIKVLSDNVPDVSSLEAWKKAFIKDGMSDQEKALSVWKSVAAFQYQDAPAPVEFIHHEDGMYDPIRMFNVYGYGICCYASSHVMGLSRYAGLNARGWGINSHSVCEVNFDNAWHLLDSSLIGYFPKADGKIASIEELTKAIQDWYAKNPALANGKHGDDGKLRQFQRGDGDTAWKAKGPEILSRSPTYNAIGWWPAGTHGWYSTMQEYDGTSGGGKCFIYEYGASLGYAVNIQLRKGEKLVRNWGNKGLHVQMDVSGGGAPESIKNTGFFANAEAFMGKLDPALKSYANGRIGNGTLEYDLPLASGEFKRGALLVDNIASKADDNAAPAIHVKDDAKPGVLIVRMPTSYVYLSGLVSGKATIGSGGGGGEIQVEISQNNGLDWKDVQKLTSSGDINIDLKDFVYRRYDYRLRFTLKGKGTGLDTLKISHDIQHSQRPLPALKEGENKVSFSAGAQESSIVVEANSHLGEHKGKQIEYTEYHPKVNNATDNGLKIEGGAEGSITVPIATPGDMTRLKLWGNYRTWGDDDAFEFRVSFDDGKTFKKVGDGAPQKFGRTAYCVADVPAGTRSAQVQFVGLRKAYMVIQAFRAEADYKDASFGFRPVKVTYEWEENGQAKKDEHIAAKAEDNYTITCGPNPKMKSISVELAD